MTPQDKELARQVGANLRARRKWCRYTQAQVCEMLDISQAVLSLYENGRRTPNLRLLTKLAELYGVDCESLLSTEKPSGFRTVLNDEIDDMLQRAREGQCYDLCYSGRTMTASIFQTADADVVIRVRTGGATGERRVGRAEMDRMRPQDICSLIKAMQIKLWRQKKAM